MLRTPKVTFTATAVTLTCLAGALYASPVVIAETMGREVTAYSPLDHKAYTQHRENTTLQDTSDASTARPESSMTEDGRQETVEAALESESSATTGSTASESVDTASAAKDASDDKTTAEPSETSTSRITSEIPQTEVTLPESQETDGTTPSETSQQAEDSGAKSTADSDTLVPEDMDSPDSITVIVNKLRALPADYTPDDLVELSSDFTDGNQQLREEAAEAAEDMFVAAQEDDIELQAISSFRSYDYQQQLYDSYLERYGDDNTNGMSSRPGHSEHQTGLAMDIDSPDGQHTLQTSFGQTEAGEWLAEHAHEYGFVVRYPEDGQDITGFQYEPWHLRYFGEQFSTRIFNNSGVAEDEFGLDPAPDYED